MKLNTSMVLAFLVIFPLLSGCGTAPTTSPITPIETAYPGVQPTSNLEDVYPLNTPTPLYPESMRGPDFFINEPVKVGDLVVTGTGPANVPIILVDVTMAGEVLATTTIKEDGTFVFAFEKPLEAGHSVGLQLGDLAGTNLDPSQFIYNEHYMDRPMIGILFTIAYIK